MFGKKNRTCPFVGTGSTVLLLHLLIVLPISEKDRTPALKVSDYNFDEGCPIGVGCLLMERVIGEHCILPS